MHVMSYAQKFPSGDKVNMCVYYVGSNGLGVPTLGVHPSAVPHRSEVSEDPVSTSQSGYVL